MNNVQVFACYYLPSKFLIWHVWICMYLHVIICFVGILSSGGCIMYFHVCICMYLPVCIQPWYADNKYHVLGFFHNLLHYIYQLTPSIYWCIQQCCFKSSASSFISLSTILIIFLHVFSCMYDMLMLHYEYILVLSSGGCIIIHCPF